MPRLALGVAAEARLLRRPATAPPDLALGDQGLQAVDLLGVVVGSVPFDNHVLHHQLGLGYSIGRGRWTPTAGAAQGPTGVRGPCIDYGLHYGVFDRLSDGAFRRRHGWSLGLQAGLGLRLLRPDDPAAFAPAATGESVLDGQLRLGLGGHWGGPPTKDARRKQQRRKTRAPRPRKNTGPGRR